MGGWPGGRVTIRKVMPLTSVFSWSVGQLVSWTECGDKKMDCPDPEPFLDAQCHKGHSLFIGCEIIICIQTCTNQTLGLTLLFLSLYNALKTKDKTYHFKKSGS